MMNKMEKERVFNLGSAMSDEEKKIILMTMPSNFLTEELERREQIMKKSLDDVKGILLQTKSNMTIDEMQDAIVSIREVLK